MLLNPLSRKQYCVHFNYCDYCYNITIFYQQEASTFCHEKLFEGNGSNITSKTTTEIKPIDTFTTPNSIDTETPADDNIRSSDENNVLLEMK